MKINNKFEFQAISKTEEIEIQTSSIRLVAKCWGNPDGIPVLAFHGWLDNAATFDNLAPLLPELRILSLDLPGHGLSDHRPSGTAYHFIDMVMDVIEVAEVLGWKNYSLLGHSMGAGGWLEPLEGGLLLFGNVIFRTHGRYDRGEP